MKKVHPEYLSQQRKRIETKVGRLKWLYIEACSNAALFHGQPGEVYRKCGKANCKCVEGGTARHGPYRIIRVFRDRKNTQITLAEGERELFEMAQRYQREINGRKEIINLQGELLGMLDELLERRILRSKAEWKKR